MPNNNDRVPIKEVVEWLQIKEENHNPRTKFGIKPTTFNDRLLRVTIHALAKSEQFTGPIILPTTSTQFIKEYNYNPHFKLIIDKIAEKDFNELGSTRVKLTEDFEEVIIQSTINMHAKNTILGSTKVNRLNSIAADNNTLIKKEKQTNANGIYLKEADLNSWFRNSQSIMPPTPQSNSNQIKQSIPHMSPLSMEKKEKQTSTTLTQNSRIDNLESTNSPDPVQMQTAYERTWPKVTSPPKKKRNLGINHNEQGQFFVRPSFPQETYMPPSPPPEPDEQRLKQISMTEMYMQFINGC